MKEMRLRVAAEWATEDLVQVLDLLAKGVLKLEGLITHVRPASEAADAYRIAFGETSCLKMILDWRHIE
jgi:3-hydroxyethyl bacteriochlorophyllide a dehydrogenase